MANREEDNDLCDYMHRLGYEVGSLRFNMRNSSYLMSELLMTPPAVEEPNATEFLLSQSEDHKPENMEKDHINHSFSDKVLTDIINHCQGSLNTPSHCSEQLKNLCKVEAELLKKVSEMCHKYEEAFSQIIHSCKL